MSLNKIKKFTKQDKSELVSQEIKDIKTENVDDPNNVLDLDNITNKTAQNNNLKIPLKHNALDGWDTGIKKVYIEQVPAFDVSDGIPPTEDDILLDTYKLKDTRKIFIPFDNVSKTIVHYVFDTLFNLGVKFDIEIFIGDDETKEQNTIMWNGAADEENIITTLRFINWRKILISGMPFSAITGRKHIISFSQDNVEMVDIYAEAAISSCNNVSAAVNINIYAKLTPNGVSYIRKSGDDRDGGDGFNTSNDS